MEQTAIAISEQRLQVIAVEIQVIQQTTRATVLSAACEIGKRLTEVKLGLPHGKWTEWLRENVECSEKQAQNMMRLWEEYGKNPNPQTYSGLSVSQAIALLSAPEDVRADLIESGAAEEMSVRELKAEIQRQKDALEERQVTIDQLVAKAEDAERLKGVYEADAIKAEGERAAAEAAKEKAEKTADAKVNAAKSAENRAVNQLQDLRASFDEREKATEQKLREQEYEIGKLKDQLNEAPEKIVEIEVTPPEVEAELDRLREVVKKAPDKTVILARDAYDRGMNEFRTCKALLTEMDPENAAKYGRAFAQALRRMAEQMEEKV